MEQYYLELVNRARANPNAEVTRLSGEEWGDTGSPAAPGLNEGLAPGTIPASAKQPLAFDVRLIEAASDYVVLLLENEKLEHFADGTPSSRMSGAGFDFSPPSGSGENLAISTSAGSHPLDRDRVEQHHSMLFVDHDYAGRGHRINLLNNIFREVGIAIHADKEQQSYFGSPFRNDVLSAENFAYSSGRIFVTGVIYFDLNGNSFYTPGESAGALTLRVETLGGSQFASGSSFVSGGYSINLAGVAAGTYRLVARNALGEEDSTQFVWNGTTNVKADLPDPGFTTGPVSGSEYLPDGLIGNLPSSLSGNGVYSDSAAVQRISRTARTRSTLVWHVRFDNDGTLADDILITGSTGSSLFRLGYFRLEGGSFVNVTAGSASGVSSPLGSSQSVTYKATVKPGRRAMGKRKGASFYLRGASQNDSTKYDRVNGTLVNRIKGPKNLDR